MSAVEVLDNTQETEPTSYNIGDPLTRGNIIDLTINTFPSSIGIPIAQGLIIRFYSMKTSRNGLESDLFEISQLLSICKSPEQVLRLTQGEIASIMRLVPADQRHSDISVENVASKFFTQYRSLEDTLQKNFNYTDLSLSLMDRRDFITKLLPKVKGFISESEDF